MTTAATLASKKTVGVAFSLCFEGLPYVFTTADADTMATAFADVDDFSDADFYSGLHILGKMGGKISPWDPSIDPDSMEFTITEQIPANSPITTTAGILASTFLKAARAQTTRTFLDASVDANDTAWTIQDGSVLTAATTTAHIGNECVEYTAKAATSLTIGTRGKFALHKCNDGTTRFSTPHRLNTESSSLKPVISNSPRSEHYGRQVMLRAHSIDPLTGVYDTVANALTLWVGRVQSYRWNGDGTMTFNCEHVIGMLKEGRLFSDQFRANLQPGMFIHSSEGRVQFREEVATNNAQLESFLSVGAQKTYAQVVELIQADAEALTVATTLAYQWTLSHTSSRITIGVNGPAFTSGNRMFLALHPNVWDLLGFDGSGFMIEDTTTGTTYDMLEKELTRRDSDSFQLVGDFAPVAYKFGIQSGKTIKIENAQGTWTNQPSLAETSITPPPPDFAEGFVQLGDIAVMAVRYDSATQLTSGGDYSRQFTPIGFSVGAGDNSSFVIRADEYPQPIPVRQVWWEKARAADVMLRFLLSTGTSTFNHADYDVLPYGLGLGVPASLLNIPSFEALGDQVVSFYLTGPEKFVDFFESQLGVSGKYAVWKDGKIALRPMALQSENIPASLTFTENNKASGDVTDPQRLQVDYSSEGIVNRCVLEYNRLADGSFRDKIQVEDSVSVTDFGVRKTLTVKGYSVGSVGEAEAWIDSVAAKVLAFWSRPFARARRSFTFQEIGNGIACGDTVLLTDSGMINPATGLHGVTNIPAVIVGWMFDWSTGIGEAELILMPEFDTTKLAAWAPTARVASYVAATKTITCEAHQYSHSSEANDYTYFAVGDSVRLQPVSPADPASPTSYQGEIASIPGTNQLRLVADPTGGAGLTGTYNVIFDEFGTVATAQKVNSFIANDADDLVDGASTHSYRFGGAVDNSSDITFGSVVYQRFVRVADVADNTAEPYSVGDYHDLIESVNGLLGHVTNTAPISEFFETAPTQVGTTYRLVYQAWIPCMGGGRPLIVGLHGHHSVGTSSASFRITLSPEIVTGTSLTVPEWLGATETAEVTTTATATKLLAEHTFAAGTVAPVFSGALPPGLWMSIEIKAGAGGETATLNGVNVREGAL